MAKRENIIPLSPLGNIIKEVSGKRVSLSAKVAAEEILDNLATKIVKKAILIAEHSNRKTIRGKDIKLAYNQIRGGI